MRATDPDTVLHRPWTMPAAPRRKLSREGRPWLSLRAVWVALQVACFTLVGWIGATLTLLPVALRGGPVGRRVWPGGPHLVRMPAPAPPREALPR